MYIELSWSQEMAERFLEGERYEASLYARRQGKINGRKAREPRGIPRRHSFPVALVQDLD
jgi:hypothetical protein